MRELKKHRVPVEGLLSKDIAKAQNKSSAADRLGQLVQGQEKWNKDFMVLFATPELLMEDVNSNEAFLRKEVKNALELLARKGILRRIVNDEFDAIEESNSIFRSAYPFLTPALREACPSVPFLFLSGTASKSAVVELLSHQQVARVPKPKLFMSSQPLPDNHVYVSLQ